jgi:ribosomal protein S12 methylthiotransferase accessory factor
VTSSQFERLSGPEVSLGIAYDHAARNGFIVSTSDVGNVLRTSTCVLTDVKGQQATGRGKGIGLQSMASAVFEAFEHYYYDLSYAENAFPAVDLDLLGSDSRLQNGSPDLELIFGNSKPPLGRASFEQLGSDAPTLEFPAVLTNPNYSPQSEEERRVLSDYSLRRYGTNSGTASGLSVDDALLHGILELVERDALGITLLQTIFAATPAAAKEIDREAIPEPISAVLTLAEQETGAKSFLWDVTSNLKIPAMLCALDVGDFCFFGSGAALSSSYAAQRAILEAVQGFHVQCHLGVRFQRKKKRLASNASRFQRCNLDAGYFDCRRRSKPCQFPADPPVADGQPLGSAGQTQWIIERLGEAGMHAYARQLHRGAFAVTQVVVPGLERFYLACHGLPVAPAARGRRSLQ